MDNIPYRALMTFLFLYQSVCSSTPSTCCRPGLPENDSNCVRCHENYYCYVRQGRPKCEKCNHCDATDNLVGITNCSWTTNQHCHCKEGYFCSSSVESTCRRKCQPCPPGQYSSVTSLAKSCKIHTNCSKLGMVVIKEGTRTQDTECGHLESLSTTSVSASMSSKSHSKESLPSQTTSPYVSEKTFLSSTGVSYPKSHTTERISRDANLRFSTGTNPNPDTQVDLRPSQQLLLIVLPVVLVLSVGLAVCIKCCKSKNLKNTLRWIDVPLWKYEAHNHKENPSGNCGLSEHQPQTDRNHCVEAQFPLGSEHREGPQSQGTGSYPSQVQQVTMEHSGKGESVTNTVGSIFIYSPGMVILGANSPERKEAAPEPGEDSPLISTPQQESHNPQQDEQVRLGTQEEEGKELSFPIPATSK
ncbi:tumor necrosis factor receptor superfamily member 8 [Chanos chanos]|uniref:Tumor necrosis factor receptor superfamily member 8 n=1 Tax=Chanos chanos TaxID=29144 RepID=A0A6J2VKQ6_CHACN|nr:tumor necrosis factor receptor superfamily member 8-like [Chanos chanos]